ncbi:hypothetical protein FQA39_LY19057 [Lamprigera yunnana]|nr:hypothetical protein FQA39_LY19057 [Lamprigera yunnana]
MWMLYAEQHWIKAIDLKSAVERLYEKLGALEFDADHEAIYGMEKYFTIQQCENLRDQYKIRRKICKKFLKGKYCAQCFMKSMGEIGLQQFLDTINKYISNSDTLDKEEYIAMEQNGKGSETTKEEESKKSKEDGVNIIRSAFEDRLMSYRATPLNDNHVKVLDFMAKFQNKFLC